MLLAAWSHCSFLRSREWGMWCSFGAAQRAAVSPWLSSLICLASLVVLLAQHLTQHSCVHREYLFFRRISQNSLLPISCFLVILVCSLKSCSGCCSRFSLKKNLTTARQKPSKRQNSRIKKTIPAIWQVAHIEGRVSGAVWLRIPLSWSGAVLDSAQASPSCQYFPGVLFLPVFSTLPILSDFNHVKVIVLETYFLTWLYSWCIICLHVYI